MQYSKNYKTKFIKQLKTKTHENYIIYYCCAYIFFGCFFAVGQSYGREKTKKRRLKEVTENIVFQEFFKAVERVDNNDGNEVTGSISQIFTKEKNNGNLELVLFRDSEKSNNYNNTRNEIALDLIQSEDETYGGLILDEFRPVQGEPKVWRIKFEEEENILFIPNIKWQKPNDIVSGTPLSATELNATSRKAGTFEYNPPIGTILPVGKHVLKATFTPTDATKFDEAEKTVKIKVVTN